MFNKYIHCLNVNNKFIDVNVSNSVFSDSFHNTLFELSEDDYKYVKSLKKVKIKIIGYDRDKEDFFKGVKVRFLYLYNLGNKYSENKYLLEVMFKEKYI